MQICLLCETVEDPFGTMKARMGAMHFLTKTFPKVAAEMALSVLATSNTGHKHYRCQAADDRDCYLTTGTARDF